MAVAPVRVRSGVHTKRPEPASVMRPVPSFTGPSTPRSAHGGSAGSNPVGGTHETTGTGLSDEAGSVVHGAQHAALCAWRQRRFESGRGYTRNDRNRPQR